MPGNGKVLSPVKSPFPCPSFLQGRIEVHAWLWLTRVETRYTAVAHKEDKGSETVDVSREQEGNKAHPRARKSTSNNLERPERMLLITYLNQGCPKIQGTEDSAWVFTFEIQRLGMILTSRTTTPDLQPLVGVRPTLMWPKTRRTPQEQLLNMEIHLHSIWEPGLWLFLACIQR
eukprot:1157884-Pelagomonas_calceolata.AAC.15